MLDDVGGDVKLDIYGWKIVKPVSALSKGWGCFSYARVHDVYVYAYTRVWRAGIYARTRTRVLLYYFLVW